MPNRLSLNRTVGYPYPRPPAGNTPHEYMTNTLLLLLLLLPLLLLVSSSSLLLLLLLMTQF